MYAKGERFYENESVADATIEDLDLDFVRSYCQRIGYGKSPEEFLNENNNFIKVTAGKEQVSVAAILLFGKNPQQYFPRAYIRFIRYDGIVAQVGKDMNVTKDIIFSGRLLDQVEHAIGYIKTQMKERTYLGHDGIFVTEEEYSEFVRTEIVVNAAIHRDYSIKGTDIQIKMFDDRLEVDSPGSFAGMVKKENIRYTHFSRNPKLAAFFKNYKYVKEFGEGVDRMCTELNALGLPNPTFDNKTFILKTTVFSADRAQLANRNLRMQPENARIQTKNARIQPKNARIQPENARIGDENARIQTKNARIQPENARIQTKNARIQPENARIHTKNARIGDEALWVRLKTSHIEFVRHLNSEKKITANTCNSIITVLEDLQENQIIRTKDVQKVLDCKDSKALRIINVMRDTGVVIPIVGQGKGRYTLNKILPKQ